MTEHRMPTADPMVMRLECLRLACGALNNTEAKAEEIVERAKKFSDYVLKTD